MNRQIILNGTGKTNVNIAGAYPRFIPFNYKLGRVVNTSEINTNYKFLDEYDLTNNKNRPNTGIHNKYLGVYSINTNNSGLKVDTVYALNFRDYRPASFYLNGEWVTATAASESDEFKNIVAIRNGTYSYINDTKNSYRFMNDASSDEIENQLDRYKANNTYKRKANMVDFYAKVLDTSYSKGSWKASKLGKISLEYARGHYYLPAMPFVKVENHTENTNTLKMFCLIRGLKIEMRKFITSINGDKYSLIFQYPDYLLNDAGCNFNSIEAIKVEGATSNTEFYYADLLFGNPESRASSYDGAYTAPLQTI